jgi:hypothetical protein
MSDRQDPITRALLRRDIFSVKAGSVVIETPPIESDELEDVLAFLKLITERLRRECFEG